MKTTVSIMQFCVKFFCFFFLTCLTTCSFGFDPVAFSKGALGGIDPDNNSLVF